MFWERVQKAIIKDKTRKKVQKEKIELGYPLEQVSNLNWVN